MYLLAELPARLSRPRRNEIIQRHLEGLSRNKIEQELGESRGTVSRELDRFAHVFNERGWEAAGGEYHVVEKLKDLIEIAQLSQERKLSLEQLVDGADVAEAMKLGGINEAQKAVKFVDSVLSKGHDSGYDAAKLIASCVELNRLTEKYGPLDKVKLDWKTTKDQLDESKQQLEKVEGSLKEARNNLATLHAKYSVDEQELGAFAEIQPAFQAFGLDIENDPIAGARVLGNLKQQGYEPHAAVSTLRRYDSLNEQISDLGKKLGELNEKLATSAESLKTGEAELSERSRVVQSVRLIESTGLGPEGVKRVIDTIVEISAQRGITKTKAVEHFVQDILANYDTSLGLAPEIERVEAHKKELIDEGGRIKLRNEKIEKEAAQRLNAINEEIKKNASTLKSYTTLIEKGVTDAMILTLDNLLTSASIGDVLQTGRALASLKEIVSKRSQEVKELETRRDEVSAAVSSLGKKKAVIDEEISKSFIEARDRAAVFTADLKELLESARPEISAVKHAFAVMEQLGRFESIMAIWDIYSEGKGEEEKVLPVMAEMLVRFEDFSKDKSWYGQISSPLQDLITAISGVALSNE